MKNLLPPEHPHVQKFHIAKKLAILLDASFEIPGIKRKIGLDPLLGMVPVIGDIIPLILSLYIIHLAVEVGVSRPKLYQMWFNVAVDAVLGFIPLVGDTFDAFWQSHLWNIQIVEAHLNNRSAQLWTEHRDSTLPNEQIIDVVAEYPQEGKS